MNLKKTLKNVYKHNYNDGNWPCGNACQSTWAMIQSNTSNYKSTWDYGPNTITCKIWIMYLSTDDRMPG